MENLSPGQLLVIFCGIILAVAGAVNTLGSAAEKIAKAWRAAKAPNDTQDERLAALEHHMKEVDEYLAMDKRRLDTMDEGNRVTQRALLALLAHGIDGNNVEQMEKAKSALEEHLINR